MHSIGARLEYIVLRTEANQPIPRRSDAAFPPTRRRSDRSEAEWRNLLLPATVADDAGIIFFSRQAERDLRRKRGRVRESVPVID